MEERNACLAGYGPCEEGLTCSRRSYKEDAFRDARSDPGIFLRILKEVNDLLKFVFLFIKSGNIRKCGLVLLVGSNLCTALAEIHNISGAGSPSCPGGDYADEDQHYYNHNEQREYRSHEEALSCNILHGVLDICLFQHLGYGRYIFYI